MLLLLEGQEGEAWETNVFWDDMQNCAAKYFYTVVFKLEVFNPVCILQKPCTSSHIPWQQKHENLQSKCDTM